MSTESPEHPECGVDRSFSEEAIRAELQHVLESPEFRASKRCQDFLRFVVEQTLSGNAESLKERTIGVQAFGRASSYDTNEDGIVRIKASEVRKRLGLYYAGTGKSRELRIELPVGGYTPVFVPVTAAEPAHSMSEAASPESAHPAARDTEHRKAPAGVGHKVWVWIVIVVVAGASWILLRRKNTVVDQFWGPVLTNPGPVLVAAAYVPVYVSKFETSERPPGAPEEYVLLTDQFVGGGDLIAASRVSGMLSRMGHPYTVRIGGVSFEDLRSSATVLIGYSSRRWSALNTDFKFGMDAEEGCITEGGKPKWRPGRMTPDFHTDEDYAIVTRVFHPQTHAMLVQISGFAQYGTEAAAEMVTNPDLLGEALQGAPKGWQRRNLQLVLQMKVVSNYPASPKVVGSYYW